MILLQSYSGFGFGLTGQVVECSLAKPQADQKTTGGSNSQKAAIFPSYPPRMGYGLVGAPYGALGGGYSGASFAQVISLVFSFPLSIFLLWVEFLDFSTSFVVNILSSPISLPCVSCADISYPCTLAWACIYIFLLEFGYVNLLVPLILLFWKICAISK